MAPTMGGRLRRLLFRNEPVRVEIEFTKGSRKRYRFIPSTAISGLMMASLPTSPSQMVDALTGRAIYPVTRFRIIGSGLPEYRISSVALVRE